jgi:nicotinate-nucleotide--dimethylbenzimidazole phosphoribosyltransferase
MALFKRKKARTAATEPGAPEGAIAPASESTEPVADESPGLTAPIVMGPSTPEPEASPAEPAAVEPAPEPPAPEATAPEPPAPDVIAPEAIAPELSAQEAIAPEPPAPEVVAPAEPEPVQPAPEPQPAAEAPAPEVEPALEQAAAEQLNETLPLALEPELRRIIDTAVARVASIELEAIRESRQLTQRSEEEAREALKYALDRSLQLVNSFELMTVTVAGMIAAMRTELDSALAALHNVDDPYSHLTPELAGKGAPALEDAAVGAPPEPVEAPAAEDAGAGSQPEPQPEPEPLQGMNGAGPEAFTEPSPEMTEMFREQILNMKSSGKTREEAERSLLRFNLGRRFLGLLDEIYSDDSIEAGVAPAGEPRRRFARRFFSRQ